MIDIYDYFDAFSHIHRSLDLKALFQSTSYFISVNSLLQLPFQTPLLTMIPSFQENNLLYMLYYPLNPGLSPLLRKLYLALYPYCLQLLVQMDGLLLCCFQLYIEPTRLNYIQIRRVSWPKHSHYLLGNIIMWQHYYYWHSRRFTPHLPFFAHGRCTVLVTTGHVSLIVRIIAYYSGDHSLKIQGFIGIVAL